MYARRREWRASTGVALIGAVTACSSSEIGSTGTSGGPRPDAGGLDGAGGGSATGGRSNAGGSSLSAGGAPPALPVDVDRCEDETPFEGATGGGPLTWLYPYGATVFPRGLGPPTLMWDGAAGPLQVEMTSARFSYRECDSYGAARFTLPVDAWQAATEASNGPADPLTLRITLVTEDGVFTLSRTVHLANGAMEGQVHYSSYGSALASQNGAVLRIRPGEAAPTLVLTETGSPPLGPCVSCHSLAADGSAMVANRHVYPGGPYESRSYTLTDGQGPQRITASLPEAGFAALYPDGSRMLTNGAPNGPAVSPFFPSTPGNVGKLVPSTSRLVDLAGAALTTNWDVPHAQMPSFSPDGSRVVYNDHDKGAGHSLWVAEFDAATNQFSNKRELLSDASRYPAWPAFTPDGRQVVFVLGTSNQFVSQLPATLATVGPVTRGSLHVVDVESGTAVPLALANGEGHLPTGDSDREHFTSVSPVASGGYFWAAFTSRRPFGNFHVVDAEDPGSKLIWVTALDMGAPAGTDPSHPAFLLPGQELGTGNTRAVLTKSTCGELAAGCSEGTECCSGSCGAEGICVAARPCAWFDERCGSQVDCCTGPVNGVTRRQLKCIGGYCAMLLD